MHMPVAAAVSLLTRFEVSSITLLEIW